MAQASTLIIDSNAESRDVLARVVTDAGHAVLAAADAAEGLALLSTLHPQVVLLDLDMPGTEPFEVIQQIRLEATDAAVLALSRVRDTGFVVRTMRTGASDFIVKPASAGAIQQAVASALARTEGPLAGESASSAVPAADRHWPDLDLLFRNSGRMQDVESVVRRAADTNATILVQGESGTGKEMVAKAIHYISQRRDRPFLKVNCASLPGELLESELFGHEKGAFTGAHRRKPGKFELAHRGTFLLDEIGEMPLGLQAKLLHVLQDGTFFRVGGSELIDADVRLVAATNKDLAAVMGAGLFREDLYYRLNVVTIAVPPLRERREEIPILAEHFLKKFCRQYERETPRISPETMRLLEEYAWPGNVRELENMIKRLVVLQKDGLLQEEIALRRGRRWSAPQPAPALVGAPAPPQPQSPPARVATNFEASVGLKEIARRAAREAERAVLKEVLDRVRWNRAEAARLLKISYKALLYKITAAGLDGKNGARAKKDRDSPLDKN
ncbi:MAG: sigma-54-dependent Fis family transcriptional regulator [Candidatus Rokubacteria bacterium]|nr:sigma-54-dependent Fis family transcriptional regulator [Candidatus Rokubacteria bacterium]